MITDDKVLEIEYYCQEHSVSRISRLKELGIPKGQFYRVIQKYKELGVTISSSSIGDWYAAVCEKLKILYDKLKEDALLLGSYKEEVL